MAPSAMTSARVLLYSYSRGRHRRRSATSPYIIKRERRPVEAAASVSARPRLEEYPAF